LKVLNSSNPSKIKKVSRVSIAILPKDFDCYSIITTFADQVLLI